MTAPIDRTGRWAVRIVPAMCLIYVGGALLICAVEFERLEDVFAALHNGLALLRGRINRVGHPGVGVEMSHRADAFSKLVARCLA